MKMTFTTKEMDKLAHLWEFHRGGVRACDNKGNATIDYRSGGGIGTAVFLICGCGQEIDVTDYLSW